MVTIPLLAGAMIMTGCTVTITGGPPGMIGIGLEISSNTPPPSGYNSWQSYAAANGITYTIS